MAMKAMHLAILVLAVVGGLYAVHMLCNHPGQSIMPSFGSH